MDIFETIKKFLEEGGKCLLIENGKPIGIILTMEEYELLRSKSQKEEKIEKEETKPETEQLLIPRINSEPVVNPINPIGAAIAKEMDFPAASADLADINLADADDITLEDLGLDELPY